MQPRIALFTKNPLHILSPEVLDPAGNCCTLFSNVHLDGLNECPRRWVKGHQRLWTWVRVRVRGSLLVSLVSAFCIREMISCWTWVRVARVSLLISLVSALCIREKTISLQTCHGETDAYILVCETFLL